MSAYICFRFASSVSPRAASSNWSNCPLFQPDSFMPASDWKNRLNSRSAVGRVPTLPKPSGCFIQWLDQ
ncbi:hypothetical protein D9M68_667640 [compost metagenome]